MRTYKYNQWTQDTEGVRTCMGFGGWQYINLKNGEKNKEINV